MALDLGVVPLAEGVESEVEKRMVREVGVDRGQGWHFGRPMPLTDLIAAARSEQNVAATAIASV